MPRSPKNTRSSLRKKVQAAEEAALEQAGLLTWNEPDGPISELLSKLRLKEDHRQELTETLEALCRGYVRISKDLLKTTRIDDYQASSGEIKRFLLALLRPLQAVDRAIGDMPAEVRENIRFRFQKEYPDIREEPLHMIELLVSVVSNEDNALETGQGRPKLNDTAIYNIASELFVWVELRAPSAHQDTKNEFIFSCLQLLNIPHPDPKIEINKAKDLMVMSAAYASLK